MNLKNTPINHLMFSDNILQFIATYANCKGLANHVHNEDISMKIHAPDITKGYPNSCEIIFDCEGLKIPDELEMCCYGCPFYKKQHNKSLKYLKHGDNDEH